MPQIATYDPSILANAQANMARAAAIGLRPGDPSWITTKEQADAFHAQDAIQQQKNQARDAAMNGGLGAAWISNPGGDPRNYSNYTGPQGPVAPVAGAPPPRSPAAPAGLNFANGTTVAPGGAVTPANTGVAPPGAGGAPYALDVNKYLDPSMAFTMGEGLRNLNSSASAAGQQFSGNTLREILKYSQGLGTQNWNNAAQLAAQQQGFGRNIDVNNRDYSRDVYTNDRDFTQNQNVDDRNFAYKTQSEDQLNAWNQNFQQQQLGVQAAANSNNLAGIIAQLQNSNIMKGGETQGAGTLGQGAAGTDAISQLISLMMGGSYANNLPQFRP